MQNQILNEVLKEEYLRMQNMLSACQQELEELPKGYVSVKRIKGKEQCYLQYRERDRIISKYIRSENREAVQQQVERRRHLEGQVRKLRADAKRLQRVIDYD